MPLNDLREFDELRWWTEAFKTGAISVPDHERFVGRLAAFVRKATFLLAQEQRSVLLDHEAEVIRAFIGTVLVRLEQQCEEQVAANINSIRGGLFHILRGEKPLRVSASIRVVARRMENSLQGNTETIEQSFAYCRAVCEPLIQGVKLSHSEAEAALRALHSFVEKKRSVAQSQAAQRFSDDEKVFATNILRITNARDIRTTFDHDEGFIARFVYIYRNLSAVLPNEKAELPPSDA